MLPTPGRQEALLQTFDKTFQDLLQNISRRIHQVLAMAAAAAAEAAAAAAEAAAAAGGLLRVRVAASAAAASAADRLGRVVLWHDL